MKLVCNLKQSDLAIRGNFGAHAEGSILANYFKNTALDSEWQ